ncbi:MAG: Fic family protein [Elusimicrobia bacterium]|nr:Fic family protein [Elusimicrobiota bacterium]
MRSFEHGYLLDQPISQSLLMLVRALGEFKGRQDLYREQSPQMLETLKKSAMVESVESSNRIEGVTMAPERLGPLVARKIEPEDRSEEEIAGCRDVLADIHTNAQRLTLSPKLILDFHKKLYAHTPEKGGRWKDKDNAIWEEKEGRRFVRFKPVSAAMTPEYMDRLCALYHETLDERKAEPLLVIASFIMDFESVHPFPDGNGRVGRLLTLLLLYHAGYEVGRYISLDRIVEQSKETYWDVLLKSSQGWHEGKHDLRPWWNYFLGTLIAAYKEFEERAGSLLTARGAKSETVRQAIMRLPDEFTIRELRRTCVGVSPDLIRLVLREIQKAGLLESKGRGPGTLWRKRGNIFKKG